MDNEKQLKAKISAKGVQIAVVSDGGHDDYISLTDIAKINYRIHTDAIKDHLLVPELPKQYQSFTYATEADVLNVAMFGKTAKQWRGDNSGLSGNIRDQATLQQLIVLSNMESLNAEMIKRGMSRDDRLLELNRVAKEQIQSLVNSAGVKRLENIDS